MSLGPLWIYNLICLQNSASWLKIVSQFLKVKINLKGNSTNFKQLSVFTGVRDYYCMCDKIV